MCSIIGDLPWHSLLAATVIKNALPALFFVPQGNDEPLLELPCTAMPGAHSSGFRFMIEPTYYQPWPNVSKKCSQIPVSTLLTAIECPWVESFIWPIPLWIEMDFGSICLPKGTTIDRFDTWVLRLVEPYEVLKGKRYTSTTRSRILRAERDVSIIDRPSQEQIIAFSDLWLREFRQGGWSGKQYSKDFFLSLPWALRDHAQLVVAEKNQQIIGGALFLDDYMGSVYYLGAFDRSYKDVCPMDLIIDYAVRKACADGKQYLNLGGIGPNRNLRVFKERFGAKPQAIQTLTHSKSKEELPGLSIQRLKRSLLCRTRDLLYHLLQRRFKSNLSGWPIGDKWGCNKK